MENNLVNHPIYYQSCSIQTRHIVFMLGVSSDRVDSECIQVIESIDYIRMNFHIATAITYLWRYGQKSKEESKRDLEKAYWYVERHRSLYSAMHNRDTAVLSFIKELLYNHE